jgi:branched-chain amino acid aminotransferase
MSTPHPFVIQAVPQPLSDEVRAQRMANLSFGKVFSEHMVVVPYREGAWGPGEVRPYGPLSLDPAANVLHYGQAIFEGFKAYRQRDGSIKSFRPEANAARFNRSARRLAMPDLPEGIFVQASDLLLGLDHAWVPETLDPARAKEQSYYFRPFMIGLGHFLGVKSAEEFAFLLIGGPAGPYFPGGVKPVTIWLEEEYVRASRGGTGSAKCAGNYAASLLPGREAAARGCSQVLYLDAIERRYLEELGGMNIFLVMEEEGRTVLVTPEKTGTLLEGITRESLIALAREVLHLEVRERRISLEEVKEGIRTGHLKEAFACGTAAVVSPIGTLKSREGDWVINGGALGGTSMAIRAALLDLQYGVLPDTRNWMHAIR